MANGRAAKLENSATSGSNYALTAQAYGVNGSGLNVGGLFFATNGATNYSVFINSPSAATNNYSIYSTGAAKSYFAGDFGIGTTSPTRKLSVYYNPGAGVGAGMSFGHSGTGGANLGILATDATNALGGNKIVFVSDASPFIYAQTLDFATKRVGFGNSIAAPFQGTSPLALVHIYNSITTEKVLMVQGITSQTADLTQWLDGSSTVLNVVNAAGSFGIGVSSPTAYLHLKAGTATASTAPLKFTSGTNLTTIENGAVEYDGTNYYVSAGGTRQTVSMGKSGSFSQVGAATTVFTVTFGGTQPNATYKVLVTPTAALSAAFFYVTNKTTTTFDVTYLAGLTGTVTFDYQLIQ